MPERECHITSLVVQARPQSMDALKEAVAAFDGAEVHNAGDDGKFVVVLETDTLYDVTDTTNAIARLDGVINATLVYHQIEQADRLDDIVETTPTICAPDHPKEVTP
mgnify:CR=1 FL=1